MVKHSNGVGYFTAENIVGVLRALPETDGTYAEVVEHAREYGVTISKTVLGKWVAEGHRDLRAGRRQRAFGRFATMYDQIKEEHCTAEANRTREFDRAMQILERTCDCGNDKMTLPDGSLADTCRECHEIEEQGRPLLKPRK